ncbi:MAG TPA: hypothetical protein PLR68_03540 [Candidatus Moranbacteria bacterium]|nr:hypothetical protein [Candidatus Moranbacteria bacterium]
MIVFSAKFAFAFDFKAADADYAGDDEILSESNFGISGEVFASNAYVGDDGGVYYRGLIIQPCVTVSHNPSGIYASVWGSIAPGQSPTSDNGEGNNAGNEIDFILGWAKDFEKVKVDASYAYYKLFPLNKWGNGDIHSFNLKFSYALTEKITPYAKFIYDCVDGEREQNGFIYRVGSTFDLHENLRIDISFGGHGTVFGTREEIISSGKVSVSFPWVIESVTLAPEIAYQKRMGYEPENGGLSEDILYAGVRVQF